MGTDAVNKETISKEYRPAAPANLQAVVVGAGPYGLSIAAHLKAAGIRLRIFGAPMSTWREQMPRGMCLKSDGFASNLSDPALSFTLEDFCRREGIKYDHTRIPVLLDTFTAYGAAFQERFVGELENKQVTKIVRNGSSFAVTLDDGETLETPRVILAIGITHFDYLPEEVRRLSPGLASHSCAHHDLEGFRGRNVTVLGAGASGLDLAALLHEAGANVTLVSRRPEVHFHERPGPNPRPLWKRLRHPQSGIGPGLRSRFYTSAPLLFHKLPAALRARIVRTHLRPAAGWPMKERVLGKLPLMLGYSLEGVEVQGDCVQLNLLAADGTRKRHLTEHIIAATGYRADLDRLRFLDTALRRQIRSYEKAPVLSRNFESSVPGLYFVGLAAANSFGPMLRFAYGSDFTARHLTQHLANGKG